MNGNNGSESQLETVFEPKYFNQVLDAISDMILVKGPKSKIVWANKAFLDFYGMSNEQLAGIIDAPFNEPDYTQQYTKDDSYVFETGKTLSIPREKVTRFDGYVGTFHTVKSAIKDPNDKTIMTVGVSRDITAQLEINRRFEEARAAYFQAAKMALLGEMAGEVAHEVNSPLTTIQVLSEILSKLDQSGKFEKDRVNPALQRIQNSVSLISKIILGLKVFPKSELQNTFIKLQICRVVQDTLLVCEERFTQNGIKLQIHCPNELLPDVFGSPTLISQVILTLLNSAHDAVFSLAEKWIRLEVTLNGEFIEVSVIASGPGISEKSEIGNTLGFLGDSQSIAEKHGGTISIHRDPENTRFLLRLPHL